MLLLELEQRSPGSTAAAGTLAAATAMAEQQLGAGSSSVATAAAVVNTQLAAGTAAAAAVDTAATCRGSAAGTESSHRRVVDQIGVAVGRTQLAAYQAVDEIGCWNVWFGQRPIVDTAASFASKSVGTPKDSFVES